MESKHLALFFRVGGSKATKLFWVRAVLNVQQSKLRQAIAGTVSSVLEAEKRFELEFLDYGTTEMGLDEQHFADGGNTKALLFLDNCHVQVFSETFGDLGDDVASADEHVRSLLWRIGRIEEGTYCSEEVHQLHRLQMPVPAILRASD